MNDTQLEAVINNIWDAASLASSDGFVEWDHATAGKYLAIALQRAEMATEEIKRRIKRNERRA